MSSFRQTVWQGAVDIAPMLVGIFPFAIVTGVSATSAGLSLLQAMGSSVVVYAGASQVAAHQLIAHGAPALVVVLTALIINLRFLMYSASLAPHLTDQSLWSRALMAAVLVDQNYALSMNRYLREKLTPMVKRTYFLAAGLVMWLVWQVGTVLGAVLGSVVPASWQLDFFVPLSFMALSVGAIRDRPTLWAGVVGGGVAVLLVGLPSTLGLFLGAVLGIAAGVWAEGADRGQ